MHPPAPLRSPRGLTLVEIMVAVGILAFALIGVAAAAFGVIASNEYNKAQTVALKDAQEVLELLSILPLEGGPGDQGKLLHAVDQINLRTNEYPAGAWGEAFPQDEWNGRDLQPHNLPAPPMWFAVSAADDVQARLAEVITVHVVWYDNTEDPPQPADIDPTAWPPINPATVPDRVAAFPPGPTQPVELVVVVNWSQGSRVAGVCVRTVLNPIQP